jgi:hypothetical protein
MCSLRTCPQLRLSAFALAMLLEELLCTGQVQGELR